MPETSQQSVAPLQAGATASFYFIPIDLLPKPIQLSAPSSRTDSSHPATSLQTMIPPRLPNAVPAAGAMKDVASAGKSSGFMPRISARFLLPAALALQASLAQGANPNPLPASEHALTKTGAQTVGGFGALKQAYLEHVRLKTLATCDQKGIRLPQDFLTWIDNDPVLQSSVYGFRQNPLPILLGLRSLELDLGEDMVRRRYPQLALAFAIHTSYRGWKS